MPYAGIPITQKGAPGGVASLGSNGLVPAAQLPDIGGDGEFRILDVWEAMVDEGGEFSDTLTRNVSISGLTNGSALLIQSYVTVESGQTIAELNADSLLLNHSDVAGTRRMGEARIHWDFGGMRVFNARNWHTSLDVVGEHTQFGQLSGSWTLPLSFFVDGQSGMMTLAYAHVIVIAWRPS